MARNEQPEIFGAESVHVLDGGDGLEDRMLVDLLGQWQLHENPVYGRVSIELCNQAEQFTLGNRIRQLVQPTFKPGFLARSALAANVAMTGGIVADEYRGQAGFSTLVSSVIRGPRGNLAS